MYTSGSHGTTTDVGLTVDGQDFFGALEASAVAVQTRFKSDSRYSFGPDAVRHRAIQLNVDHETRVFGACLNAAAWNVGGFRSLAGAIAQAVKLAGTGAIGCQAGDLLTICDPEQRLVLAGAAVDGGVAWCHPVRSDAEARAVVQEAFALRGQAMRLEHRQGHSAQDLRWQARLLEGRLVDPRWRDAACQALGLSGSGASHGPVRSGHSQSLRRETAHA